MNQCNFERDRPREYTWVCVCVQVGTVRGFRVCMMLSRTEWTELTSGHLGTRTALYRSGAVSEGGSLGARPRSGP